MINKSRKFVNLNFVVSFLGLIVGFTSSFVLTTPAVANLKSELKMISQSSVTKTSVKALQQFGGGLDPIFVPENPNGKPLLINTPPILDIELLPYIETPNLVLNMENDKQWRAWVNRTVPTIMVGAPVLGALTGSLSGSMGSALTGVLGSSLVSFSSGGSVFTPLTGSISGSLGAIGSAGLGTGISNILKGSHLKEHNIY